MRTRNPIVEQANAPPRFLHVNFNQDHECFSCATETGFEIYNNDPVQCSVKRKFAQGGLYGMSGIGYTRMLYRTNYIALVGGGTHPRFSTNKIAIWDDIQQKDSISLKFKSPVREIFLSRQYIIVVLSQNIELFTFSGNPTRICPPINHVNNGIADFVTCNKVRRDSSQDGQDPLASHVLTGILAYPSSIIPGQIHVADLSNLQVTTSDDPFSTHLPTSIIKAHKNSVRMVKLNRKGTLVATCSVEGTLVRIFSIASGSLVREFRRGLDRALIFDMQWDEKGNNLAVVSDKYTLHVFQIDKQLDKRHVLKGWFPKVKYLQGIWSMCSIKLDKRVLTHEDDKCKIGWIGDSSLSVIWQKSGVWEKYVIMEKIHEVNPNDPLYEAGGAPIEPKIETYLVREGWRQL
ncbi:HBL258Wp [Eremothecium sinecaudum]|uniref:HBL258Wp n=1 Tax=Eremothecium sinecaudum TaxID=45286 RepID=A0A120K0S3_9SACH|nr:HBL258Wp [Eremothecium sinecaudum]AMD18644.1 HBL258Wp [Eremothecium sinecaudum]